MSLLICSVMAISTWDIVFHILKCLAGYYVATCKPFALTFKNITSVTCVYDAGIQTPVVMEILIEVLKQ